MEVQEYRESIFLINESGKSFLIPLSNWGAGEIKIDYEIKEFISTFDNHHSIRLFIPYLNFKTLEKAYVFTRFCEKQGIKIGKTIIGYFNYSRQERETDKEPELLSEILSSAENMLCNIIVVDAHDSKSFVGIENTSVLPELSEKIGSSIIVAPDKGAKKRNDALGINTQVILKKCRKDGKVFTDIDYIDPIIKNIETKRFVILDDICDGGRTFANAAKLLKDLYPNSEVILAVSHAIIPYGVSLLKESGIDKIITVNSCLQEGEYLKGFIKVYNIFNFKEKEPIIRLFFNILFCMHIII